MMGGVSVQTLCRGMLLTVMISRLRTLTTSIRISSRKMFKIGTPASIPVSSPYCRKIASHTVSPIHPPFLHVNLTDLLVVLPNLFSDVDRVLKTWGPEGQVNLFDSIYRVVFQMTIRMATCDDLAMNAEDVVRVRKLYWTLEKTATAVSVLMPWIPSKAKKENKQATVDLYMLLNGYVEKRRKVGERTPHAIDHLIAEGVDNEGIIMVSMLRATSVNSYMLTTF